MHGYMHRKQRGGGSDSKLTMQGRGEGQWHHNGPCRGKREGQWQHKGTRRAGGREQGTQMDNREAGAGTPS